MQWNIKFYEDENGKSEIKEFLEGIENKKLHAKVLKSIELLSSFGTDLKEPHAKHLEDGIWELRTQQSNNISRVLYFTFSKNEIVLLNGFIKKRQKTPPKAIEKAKKYRDDYKRRYDE